MRNGRGWRRVIGLVATVAIAAGGCGGAEPPGGGQTVPPTPSPSPSETQGPRASPDDRPDERNAAAAAASRPEWLGTRELPRRPDGIGEVRDTPAELVNRQFPPPDATAVEDTFAATIGPVPDDVVARSTWSSECPVTLADLRYLTLTFWGFDGRSYAGEMIVHRSVAEEMVWVFEQLYEARFPIEEMRVVASEELAASPTGDGNNTSAFVCRPSTLSTSWSQHAYGLAVDVNPFHNPYRRGDAVVPELASAYLDRTRDRPGMIQSGDVVTRAFADIGWAWGGDWATLDDWMHFSRSGR